MEDLSNYSIEAIYEMIKAGTISVEDLANYIMEVVPDMEATEELRDFLEVADKYIDDRIKSGVETSEPVVEEYHESSEPNENPQGTTSTTSDDVTPDVIPSPLVTQQEVIEEIPVQEASEEVEQSEPIVSDSEYPYFEIDGNSYDEARRAMDQTYNYCQTAGMSIEEISLAGKNGRGPYITFEINNESKIFLDHLMLEFYQNSDGISLEFMRDMSTRSEFFTLEIDPANMSQEEFYAHVKATFDRIYRTIETTRKDFDYESTMPDGLKNIKDRFTNDDPNINQDFTIGYVRNDGKDSYYIVADDVQTAVEYARTIGYDIKNSQGANIFEIDTKGSSVIDTKLSEASIDLSSDYSALDIGQNGVSELDIYGSLSTDPKVGLIENFIETSNDPHIMCILEIEIPPENTSQRIVKLKSETGTNDVVVFTDGQEFDQKVLPKIVDTYAENNPTSKENVTIGGGNSSNTVSCQMESENNTTLIVDGYTKNEVNHMITNIESKSQSMTNQQELEKANVRQKTIGTYQNKNNNTTAFVSMPVLFVICILFILMISLIIFAG